GDKNHLRQLVTNFISNAVKYTENGSVCLSARTIPQENDTALFRITVSDTGIGIPKKELDHIFEIFRRGKNAVESAVEGTGLGLAISKELADSMGGKLIAESTENKGSTFGIEVIQNVIDGSPVGNMTSIADEHTCTDSFIAPECRILAVDDNPENLRVIKMLLERTMITVDTASDGITAADMAQASDYDMIFLDYMMPVTDGIETLKIMRKNGLPEKVPVVALTAEALSGSEDKFLSAGFTSYLSKPVSHHELEKTLITLLPAEKVMISGTSDEKLSDEELKRLSSELKKYDIDLEAGISYLSGNITRFCSLAEIFADGYDSTCEKVRRMFSEHDESIVYEVHSLKSAAKGIGAMTLYEQAYELEKRSNGSDAEYVSNAENLLMLEWKRAADGMRYLLAEMSDRITGGAGDISEDDLETQIRKGLEEHIWLDTQNALQQLIEKETDSERIKELTYIAEFVDELDFVSAKALFGRMMKNDSK
ncbi:MAG: response regulator, partial [Oscillospiraceae bacterium]|nr:response regulator [Oscillospiraceae bacterium]